MTPEKRNARPFTVKLPQRAIGARRIERHAAAAAQASPQTRPLRREVELTGVAARCHEIGSRERQDHAERLATARAAAHRHADVAQHEHHAQALHDRGRGGVGPVDGLEVGHLREEDRAQAHAEMASRSRGLLHTPRSCSRPRAGHGGRGEEEPAGGELAQADEPEGSIA